MDHLAEGFCGSALAPASMRFSVGMEGDHFWISLLPCMSAFANSGHSAALANVRVVPILLQKSLKASAIDDSLAVTRFVAEACDDGAAQSRSKAAFLFILSRGCGSAGSSGPSDCGGARPFMGACRACASLFQCWQAIDRSGAYDSDAGHWLRFCDSLGTAAMPASPGQSPLSLLFCTFNP